VQVQVQVQDVFAPCIPTSLVEAERKMLRRCCGGGGKMERAAVGSRESDWMSLTQSHEETKKTTKRLKKKKDVLDSCRANEGERVGEVGKNSERRGQECERRSQRTEQREIVPNDEASAFAAARHPAVRHRGGGWRRGGARRGEYACAYVFVYAQMRVFRYTYACTHANTGTIAYV